MPEISSACFAKLTLPIQYTQYSRY